ncbi:unnamed protein product [Soboliphyme baturini]|uniref:PWWP domain-containing protein n=1 Tax=Soboliphyme baturini TaxID=241478 RepID=A0A183J351_9BILA|nr:unnamed protein product [Soboliphyme baturini]
MIFANKPVELPIKNVQLQESLAISPEKNISVMKWKCNEYWPASTIFMDGNEREKVTTYLYLGHLISSNSQINGEIIRRRTSGMGKFQSHQNIVARERTAHVHERNCFVSAVLSAMIFGAVRWSITHAKGKKHQW